MSTCPILIAGQWRPAAGAKTFHAENPRTLDSLPEAYPVSPWEDCHLALDAATAAARQLQQMPAEPRAAFLERYAERIAARAAELVEIASLETALAASPRLADVELPRTTDQLRQAAAAARDGSWALPTIDTRLNIRSCLAPLGIVLVFGPNNFPFAFNSVAGGDFAAAIAAGNAVIAKANTSHPGTTRRLAEEAALAARETGLPDATVQLLYRLDHEDGQRLAADRRVGATAYTGSRAAGLVLKAAADAAGKPIYLELSSINPVLVLPGALRERATKVAEDFTASCLLGSGQFCTSPGLVLLLAGPETAAFLEDIAARFRAAPVQTLLSSRVAQSLAASIERLRSAGAQVLSGGQPGGGQGASHSNTLLRVTGEQFLKQAEQLQTEAFGNASLVVVATDVDELTRIIDRLEGNLTGTVYSHAGQDDESLYAELAPRLRGKVGRLLNDKMPTGVAVSPAMNHGGPYPATGHPGFTAVGMPAALRRFAMLACYDQVRQARLPPSLQDKNPNGQLWRSIDGVWSQGDVTR